MVCHIFSIAFTAIRSPIAQKDCYLPTTRSLLSTHFSP